MINQRQFLQITGAGTASLLTGGISSLLNIKGANAASSPSDEFLPDLDIALKATRAEISILPEDPTSVWRFQGKMLKGNQASLINIERSYLGPIIGCTEGRKSASALPTTFPTKPSSTGTDCTYLL